MGERLSAADAARAAIGLDLVRLGPVSEAPKKGRKR